MNWAAGELVERWNRGPCYTELDRAIQRRGLREAACPPHVGDLLEPGQWTEGLRYGPADDDTRLAWRYRHEVPGALGQCTRFRVAQGLVAWCMLPANHAPWPDAVPGAKGCRFYFFSPRDSAQMLDGMRARLTEPMEEL